MIYERTMPGFCLPWPVSMITADTEVPLHSGDLVHVLGNPGDEAEVYGIVKVLGGRVDIDKVALWAASSTGATGSYYLV